MAILTSRTELDEKPAVGDFLHIVDVSDTTDNPAGTSKKITKENLTLNLFDTTSDDTDDITEGTAKFTTAAEASKLAGIEALADVTDTANVTSSGALMDSEVTNLADVKAFDTTDYATSAQGATADSATQPGDNVSDLTNDAGYITAQDKSEYIIIGASDETTALEVGTAKTTFRIPWAGTITGVRASVTTAPTDAVLTVDINKAGTSILSTKITIDSTEKTSVTAATAPVISTSAVADDDEYTIDIDTVGSTVAGTGLKITILGTRS